MHRSSEHSMHSKQAGGIRPQKGKEIHFVFFPEESITSTFSLRLIHAHNLKRHSSSRLAVKNSHPLAPSHQIVQDDSFWCIRLGL